MNYFPPLVYWSLILWNLRLVCLEYCSWFSTLISSSEIVLNWALISASCSFIDQPCFNTFCSSLVILSDCSVNCLECPSITSCCSLMVICCICWSFTVLIRGLMLLSTHDWILDYHRYNSFGNTGIILSSTSVLVRASMTLSVTFCLWTGDLVVFLSPSHKSPTELRRRICLPSVIWVAGKSLGLSGNGLLFDLGVFLPSSGWQVSH